MFRRMLVAGLALTAGLLITANPGSAAPAQQGYGGACAIGVAEVSARRRHDHRDQEDAGDDDTTSESRDSSKLPKLQRPTYRPS